jgi:hypothetical protein
MLTGLNMPGNEFTGEIPESLGQLLLVTRISFDRNQLTGKIPTSIGVLPNLKIFRVTYNQLSGEVPPFPNLERDGEDDNYPCFTYENPMLCGDPNNVCVGREGEAPQFHPACPVVTTTVTDVGSQTSTADNKDQTSTVDEVPTATNDGNQVDPSANSAQANGISLVVKMLLSSVVVLSVV